MVFYMYIQVRSNHTPNDQTRKIKTSLLYVLRAIKISVIQLGCYFLYNLSDGYTQLA